MEALAFGLVAIALSVVTFGAATPVIVAAGAGLAGAALGTWAAIEEIATTPRRRTSPLSASRTIRRCSGWWSRS